MNALGFHVNPLRKKKIFKTSFSTGLKGEATAEEEHMTLSEAAIVAFILTVAQIFMSFLTFFDWTQVSANPGSFLFDLLKFAGGTFFSIFVVLSGIARYMSK